MIEEYFQSILQIVAAARLVRTQEVALDKRSEETGFVRGNLYFVDNSRLHFRELVKAEEHVERVMYVYHYQAADDILIFRYDNTDHPTQFPDTPHHKHDGSQANMRAVAPPDLAQVLAEIEGLIA